MKSAVLFLALVAPAGMAAAQDLRIPLPDGVTPRTLSVSYVCAGGGPLRVQYLSAEGISLAVLPVEGQQLVFANVLAASGVRYAAGAYVWWEQGQSASLYDIRQGENAAPVLTCTQKD